MPIEFLKDVTVNGDVNIPEYINHIGDPHTKLGFVANGNFAVFTDNGNLTSAERFRITNGGYVGIGTKNPSTHLEVEGGAKIHNNLNIEKGRIGVREQIPRHPLHVRGAGYLSEGIYLGGETYNNLLDDYEEGYWAPEWETYNWIDGKKNKYSMTPNEKDPYMQYTKIGNLVYCQFYYMMEGNFPWPSSSTLSLYIRGGSLPFQPSGRVVGLTGSYQTRGRGFYIPKSNSIISTPSLFPYRPGGNGAYAIGLFATKDGQYNFETVTTDAVATGKRETFEVWGSFVYHTGSYEYDPGL